VEKMIRTLVSFVIIFVIVFSVNLSLVFAADRDNNPPGPKGGKGTNWENPPGPKGGPGAGPNRGQGLGKPNPPGPKGGPGAGPNRGMGGDRSYNPPGPKGGPGTNWENPPGPQGGPGASPDQLKEKALVSEPWEKEADTNRDGMVDQTEAQQWKQAHPGRGYNPPGPQGGPGAEPELYGQRATVDRPWEKEADINRDGLVDQTEMQQWKQAHPDRDYNPPGPQGGPGASPDTKPKLARDNNPPGPNGGPGTNWENPPGPQGGPGTGPNRGQGLGKPNPPGPKGGPGAGPARGGARGPKR